MKTIKKLNYNPNDIDNRCQSIYGKDYTDKDVPTYYRNNHKPTIEEFDELAYMLGIKK